MSARVHQDKDFNVTMDQSRCTKSIVSRFVEAECRFGGHNWTQGIMDSKPDQTGHPTSIGLGVSWSVVVSELRAPLLHNISRDSSVGRAVDCRRQYKLYTNIHRSLVQYRFARFLPFVHGAAMNARTIHPSDF
jgi:hypothetical protein